MLDYKPENQESEKSFCRSSVGLQTGETLIMITKAQIKSLERLLFSFIPT
jgi:hypothetical protein